LRKILLISAFPPCNKTAGQSYTNRLIQDLSKNNKIDLIYFSYQNHQFDFENDNIEVKRIIRTSLIVKFFSSLKLFLFFPFFTSRFSLRVLWFILMRNKNYDCIYFDFSQVFIYSLFINHKYKILMSHDVIIQKYHRLDFKLRWLITSFCSFTEKIILCKKENKILVFSEKDRKILKNVYNINSRIVDFYVDQQIYQLKSSDFQYKFDFVLFAAWNRDVNKEGLTWFIDNVLKEINIMPNIRMSILILGNGLPEELQESLSLKKDIQIIGYVDNPYAYIAASRCLIAPIFNGAGVKVKVLESAFCATWVLGTNVALEGISNDLQIKCKKFENSYDLIDQMKEIMSLNYSPNEKYTDHLEILKIYPKKQFMNYFSSDLAIGINHS